MTIAIIPTVRTPLTAGETGVPIINLNWTGGVVLALASPGSKSAVLMSNTDGVVELSSDTQCWFTVAGTSALGTTAGAGVAVAGSQLLPQGTIRQVYIPNGGIIGAIAYSSGNLSIVPAYQTT